MAEKIKTQLKSIIRGLYKSPPSYGAQVVAHILNTPRLLKQYQHDIEIISSVLKQKRQLLKDYLEKLGTPGNWNHLTETVGLLSDIKLSGKYFYSRNNV